MPMSTAATSLAMLDSIVTTTVFSLVILSRRKPELVLGRLRLNLNGIPDANQ
ncbi:hypothetical protein CPC08DRAFT_714524 [Agrocybe pediades]|nr:hypothetical protein CPC08DRAFT_714524 [Agrocybe pediades]